VTAAIPVARSRHERALKIQTILVPVAGAGASKRLVLEAAWLARRLHADIVLLHVMTDLDDSGGLLESGNEITTRDWHERVVQTAEDGLDRVSEPELDGLAVTRLLLKGDPATEIVRTAGERSVGLIMMSTVGSVMRKVLRDCECPVWTGIREPHDDSDWLRRGRGRARYQTPDSRKGHAEGQRPPYLVSRS